MGGPPAALAARLYRARPDCRFRPVLPRRTRWQGPRRRDADLIDLALQPGTVTRRFAELRHSPGCGRACNRRRSLPQQRGFLPGRRGRARALLQFWNGADDEDSAPQGWPLASWPSKPSCTGDVMTDDLITGLLPGLGSSSKAGTSLRIEGRGTYVRPLPRVGRLWTSQVHPTGSPAVRLSQYGFAA